MGGRRRIMGKSRSGEAGERENSWRHGSLGETLGHMDCHWRESRHFGKGAERTRKRGRAHRPPACFWRCHMVSKGSDVARFRVIGVDILGSEKHVFES